MVILCWKLQVPAGFRNSIGFRYEYHQGLGLLLLLLMVRSKSHSQPPGMDGAKTRRK